MTANLVTRFLIFVALSAIPGRLYAEPVSLPADVDQHPELKNIYAGRHQLDELLANHEATVFAFINPDCPVAQQYVPRFQELYRQFEQKSIRFLAVYSNRGLNIATIAKHAHDADLPFPAMLDIDCRLAKLLKVRVTPEVVVVSKKREKLYQGAIDNQFTNRGRISKPTKHHLRDALTAIVGKRKIANRYVSPTGCRLEYQPPPPPRKGLTYYKDIAPIMQQHCQRCHRPGNVAPFSLLKFEDVYYRTTTIGDVIAERRMPPFHAYLNPKFGKLANNHRLSDDEVRTVLDWIRSGGEEGDPKDAPKPLVFPPADQWKIGKPDLVYKMPKPFPLPKSGVLDYQFFRVNLNFDKDRWIQAAEIRPGNQEVVHHITLHLVPSSDKKYSGFAGMAELYGLNAEQARLIQAYVPGDEYSAKTYPAGQAVRIPANTDIVFELHYTPNNRAPTTDQSMVGFRWAKAAPKQEILTHVFRKPIGRFRIPPHHPHYKITDTFYFKHDVKVDAVLPHFHLRGKSYRLEKIERDPDTDAIVKRETILSVPVWDPDWQRTLELQTPLLIKAGTELLATGHYDNSALNPNNPDPSIVVHWGQQTTDEMFSTRFIVRRAEAQK